MKSQVTEIVLMPGRDSAEPPTKTIAKTAYSDDGQVQVVKTLTHVPLSSDRGELYRERGGWTLTALAYDKANLYSGVSLHCPETIRGDDGTILPNPSIIRNKRTGGIDTVRVRMQALGRSATGNLMMHDLTISYDLHTYMCQDLWSKWAGGKNDSSTKTWGKVMRQGVDPELEDQWMAFPMPTGVNLWVDLSHREVITVLGEHHQRQKFAERQASTICRRNLLRRFITYTKVADGNTTIPVYGWSDLDRDIVQVARVIEEAKTQQLSDRFVAPTEDGDQVEVVVHGTKSAGDKEEIDAALHGSEEEVIEEEPTPEEPKKVASTVTKPPPKGPETAVPSKKGGVPPRLAKARRRIRAAMESMDEKVATDVVDAMGFSSIADALGELNVDSVVALADALEEEKKQGGAA